MRAGRPSGAARERQRGRWLWWLAPALIASAGLLWWTTSSIGKAAPATPGAPSASATAFGGAVPQGPDMQSEGAAGGGRASSSPTLRVPYAASAAANRQAQLAMWQQRLARAQATLAAYRQATRYPHSAQPLSEHADQAYPNQPITEDKAFVAAGGTHAANSVHLHTSQERVFVQGAESVRFTLSLVDDAGHPVALRVLRAAAREVPAAGGSATFPEVPLAFADGGSNGDQLAGDGTYTTTLQPASQGFGGLLGQIRVEAFLQYQAQPGYVFFDIVYTPDTPATWKGEVTEALEDGSLNFYLPADVHQPGRYVVTGRVDDARGQPVALLTFNDEVPAGSQAFKLSLFGKLVRDLKPVFPLVLRDVDAFRLRPDAFPDRSLMPRRPGTVHTTAKYVLASFADGEWTSEERQRYLDELGKDVDNAQTRVGQLTKGP